MRAIISNRRFRESGQKIEKNQQLQNFAKTLFLRVIWVPEYESDISLAENGFNSTQNHIFWSKMAIFGQNLAILPFQNFYRKNFGSGGNLGP